MSRPVLDARHQVASAAGATLDVVGHITRALAWQLGDEPSVVADLEVALQRLANAERMLYEAIVDLRRANQK